MAKANESFARSDPSAQVDHWAYMAGQRAAIAQEVTRQRSAEKAVAGADARARSLPLEAQMKAMNAKKTDRSLVVIVGDVLFDTNQSQLNPGGLRNMEKVVGFLKQYPMRKVLIESFTDSSGSDSANQQLSDRRADAVRSALVESGVSGERIRTQDLGEAYPVASNDSAGARQMNRRVEIVLSDDSGQIVPR